MMPLTRTLSTNSIVNSNNENASTMNQSSNSILFKAIVDVKKMKKLMERNSHNRRENYNKYITKIKSFHADNLKQNLRSSYEKLKSSYSSSLIFTKGKYKSISIDEKLTYKTPSRLSFEINRLFDDNCKYPKVFSNSCTKIRGLKLILNFAKESENRMEINLQKRLALIENSITQSQNKLMNINLYLNKANRYLIFLKDVKNKEDQICRDLLFKKYTLENDIERLKYKIEIVGKAYLKNLEYRNFLLRVKMGMRFLPQKFYDIHPLINKDLIKKVGNNEIILQKKKKEYSKIEELPKLIEHSNTYKKNFDYSLDKFLDPTSEKIFNSVDEFYRKFNFFENILLKLLNIENNASNEIREKLEELNKLNSINVQHENYQLRTIQLYEEELEQLKIKNFILNKKANIVKRSYHKNTNRSLKKLLSKIPFEFPIEKSLQIIKLNELQKEKNFQCENGYVYYYIYQMIKEIYNLYPIFLEDKDPVKKMEILKKMDLMENPDILELSKVREICISLLIYIEVCFQYLIKVKEKYFSNKKQREQYLKIWQKKKELKSLNHLREQRNLILDRKTQKSEELEEKQSKLHFKNHCGVLFNHYNKKSKDANNPLSRQRGNISYFDALSYEQYTKYDIIYIKKMIKYLNKEAFK